MALQRDCSFPLFVFRPVLLVALRRLAETCFSEAMVWFALQLGSFDNLPRPVARPPGVDPQALAVEILSGLGSGSTVSV